MRTQSLIVSLILLPLVACSAEKVQEAETAPEATEQPAVLEKVSGSSKGEKRAAEMVAATVCMVADPSFWEGFMGDDGEGGWIDTSTPEGEAKAEAQQQEFYGKFGYSGEAEAQAEVERYITKPSFSVAVENFVQELCPELVSGEMLQGVLQGMQNQ